MAEDHPSVSVIIPVHNGHRYLSEAIDSVLCQGDYSLDILVVDDGSLDDSGKIARSFGAALRYHYQTQLGAAQARNVGVALTEGELIAFLDADDIWTPNKLTTQLTALAKDTDLDMVFGHTEQFVSPDLDEDVRRTLQCASEPMPAYLPSAILVKRRSFNAVGPFSSDFEVGEFIDWYARAMDAGLSSSILPEVLLRRRIHRANQGVIKRDSYQAEYMRILRKSLQRRRAAARKKSE